MVLTPEEIAFLSEMFPDRPSSYFIAHAPSFPTLNAFMDHILTPCTLEVTLSDFIHSTQALRPARIAVDTTKRLNYPEVFCENFSDHRDPLSLRRAAQELFEMAPRKCVSTRELLYADAKRLNRLAAIITIRRMLRGVERGTVDLHGLEVKESLNFLRDYGDVKCVVTGNSTKIKPAVVRYYEGMGYEVTEDRTVVYIKKKK